MRPKLFDLGDTPIHSYGALMLLSGFVCGGVLWVLLKRRRQDPVPSVYLALLMLGGYIFGARVLYSLLHNEWQLQMMTGFWGGQIAFGAFAGIYLLCTRKPMRPLADALAVSWAATTVVHKLGCFLAGCCYGTQTSVPWAVTFPYGGMCGLAGVPVHPTQLYDAGSALLISGVLGAAYLRSAGAGRLILWFSVLYGATKFASDLFRGDAHVPVAGRFPASLVVEAVVFLLGSVLLIWRTPWDRLLAWKANRMAAGPSESGTAEL